MKRIVHVRGLAQAFAFLNGHSQLEAAPPIAVFDGWEATLISRKRPLR